MDTAPAKALTCGSNHNKGDLKILNINVIFLIIK